MNLICMLYFSVLTICYWFKLFFREELKQTKKYNEKSDKLKYPENQFSLSELKVNGTKNNFCKY